IAPRSLRILDRDVDSITRDPDLAVRLEPTLAQLLPYRKLKRRFGLSSRRSGFGREATILREREIPLQHLRSVLLNPRLVNVVRLDGGDEHELPPRPRERDVQAPLA